MTTPASPVRAVLSLGLIVGITTACAHSTTTSRDRAAGRDRQSAVVTAEDIRQDPSTPIEELLKSRVAGVHVTRAADGGVAVRLRGGTSIHGSNEPLYVVDGIAFQPGPGGSLTGINPYDIESIRVLKDPVDTAMYGVRGANGVIVIKTKRAGS